MQRTPPADARDRLLSGLRQCIEEKGYRQTTLTDVVRAARASRRTFYLVFATKDDALLALIDKINDDLVRDLSLAVDDHSNWRNQVVQAIGVYFDNVSRHPAVHLCGIRELPYLGVSAEPVIRRGNDAMVAIIHKLSDNEEFRREGLSPSPRPLAMMIIGALNELVADTLESGRDILEERDLAIAVTTALLATNFKDSGVADA
ncbi:TetR/AcrR family transcriptional regulator [Streptomyces spongiae]|uniref:TetR/AcrR family transcriptional regulator n=1 Tax=Streptomyces spongiae TaxID=565072 RepID=UPI00128C64B4|nr:TetR/AcrR family transcriptional regulator [Streptomyces spongiae]